MPAEEKLGAIPVLEQGPLSFWKQTVTPVSGGRVLMLHGPEGTYVLPSGRKTDMDLRRRYDTYTLVDTGASEIEFSEEFRTSDKKRTYRVTVKASARVADPEAFVSQYGEGRRIGVPLVNLWRNNIVEIVNQKGDYGLDHLQQAVLKLQKEIENQNTAGKYIGGCIQVLGCLIYVTEDDKSLILRALSERGAEAIADLTIIYPHLKTEIVEWAKTRANTRTIENESYLEDINTRKKAIEMHLDVIRQVIEMGADPDIVLGDMIKKAGAGDLLNIAANPQATEPPKQIEGSSSQPGQPET